jgi:hypothetical protein
MFETTQLNQSEERVFYQLLYLITNKKIKN